MNDLLSYIEDPELELEALIHELEQWPTLVRRILAGSGSVLLGRQPSVQNLQYALIYLGLNRIAAMIRQELFLIELQMTQKRAA